MKDEFLKNFQVGGQPLTQEIIDAILTENGRDVEAAKAPFADYHTVKEQLANAQKALKDLEGQDIETARQAAKDWEDKCNQALRNHEAQLANLAFERTMETAITGAKGRSVKAISALLDLDALKSSKNQEQDIKAALEVLKKDNAYLFADDNVPPHYAPGAGNASVSGKYTPQEAAIRSAAGLKIN